MFDDDFRMPTREVNTKNIEVEDNEELLKLEYCKPISKSKRRKDVDDKAAKNDTHAPQSLALTSNDARVIVLNNYCCSEINCLLKLVSLERAANVLMDCR